MNGLMDTRQMTSEEPTTPDLLELLRRQLEAANRRDLDCVTSNFAPDAVWDGRVVGDHCEGRPAIRSLLEDWFGAYEELEFGLEEVRDLGNGIVCAVVIQNGRPVSSAGHLRQREGWVLVWVRGLIEQFTSYGDVDEARAAAERLAEERGHAMSQQNVEIIHRAYLRVLAGERGPVPGLFHPDAEYRTLPTDPDAAVHRGIDEIARHFRDWGEAFSDLRSEPIEIKGNGDSVFVWVRLTGQGTLSRLPVESEYAGVWTLREGKVIRVVEYVDRVEALKAVGLRA
jgi:ketosteroid isomerase-like protein